MSASERAPRVLLLLGRRGRRIIEPLCAAGLPVAAAIADRARRSRWTVVQDAVTQLRTGGPWDIAVADAVETVLLAGGITTLLRVPLVAYVHGDAWSEIDQPRHSGVLTRLPGIRTVVAAYGGVLRRCVAVVPCARYLGLRVTRAASLRSTRVHPVPYALDCGRFGLVGRAAARERLRWDDRRVVLSVTNFRFPSKVAGLDALTPWMRALMDRCSDVRWVVAGGGPEAGAFAARTCERLGSHAARFEMAGFVSEMPLLYAACDVVAYFTGLDALPVAVLEAQASSRPVVANPVAGIPEMIADGETGFLCEPGPAFVDRVALLLDDPALAARMGAAARGRVEREHAPAQIGARWRELLEAARAGAAAEP